MTSSTRTVFFADICDSTRMYEVHGDAQARRIVRDLLLRCAQSVSKHGGQVIKTIGDEIMAAFPNVDGALSAATELLRDLGDGGGIATPGYRIGFHHGDVLFEANDLYGATVNTAARMVSLARCRQIITTAETFAMRSENLGRVRSRSLGEHYLPGILQPREVVEILVQVGTNTTSIRTQPYIAEQSAHTVLELQRGHINLAMSAGDRELRLGRDSNADVVVNAHYVSRVHALIEFRRGFFMLRDVSTNGTYVALNNGDVVPLHRNELMLRGNGAIHLGREPEKDPGKPVRFHCH